MSATLFILLVTLAVSLYAFSQPQLTAKLMFDTDAIKFRREYHRFLSSSLVHADLMHLIFNLYVIYMFGEVLEGFFGSLNMAMLYLASVAGGDTLCWVKYKNTSYRGLGASGGALGLIFSLILVAPTAFSIWFIPAWLFGVLYIVYSVWSARSGRDNIGHVAHLGGGFTGFFLTALFTKGVIAANSLIFVGILALFVGAWFALFSGPLKFSERRAATKQDKQRKNTVKDRERLDQLLDKVAREGIHSLSKSERAFLEAQSRERRGGR